jgi:hypothetical protein
LLPAIAKAIANTEFELKVALQQYLLGFSDYAKPVPS